MGHGKRSSIGLDDPGWNWPRIFNTLIPQANQIAGAAEWASYSTLKQKWGYGGLHERFSE